MERDFNCEFTCPIIDNSIEHIKERIRNNLKWVVKEISPTFYDTEEGKEFVDEKTQELYKDLSFDIEAVRETNENMRDKAESQIGELWVKIDSLRKNSKKK